MRRNNLLFFSGNEYYVFSRITSVICLNFENSQLDEERATKMKIRNDQKLPFSLCDNIENWKSYQNK